MTAGDHASRVERPDVRYRRTSGARMKALRQRARDGKAIVSIEIDLVPVTELLIDNGLLPITSAEDRAAIGHALEKLLALVDRRP
jgi:hypothetical protein